MRFVLFVALLATPTLASERPTPAKPACKEPGMVRIGESASRPGVHPLTDEPPAKQMFAVIRLTDGCIKPVFVHANAGLPRAR